MLNSQPGVSVVAIIPQEGVLHSKLTACGITTLVISFPVLRKSEMRGYEALKFPFRTLISTLRLGRTIRRLQGQVVYVSTIICPVWIAAARLVGRRVICHVHENQPDMGRARSRILLSQLRLAHVVVANSESTREWIVGVNGSSSSVKLIYNGVMVPWSPRRIDVALSSDTLTKLLLVGRISNRKGQDIAIQAVDYLLQRGYVVDLTLVGGHYPGYEAYVDELHVLVAGLGLDHVIHFEGYCADSYPFYFSSDVALVPSKLPESFGNVAVEALLSGIPTIVTNIGGLSEIVRPNETGLVIPPNDPLALSHAITRLIDDSQSAAAMAAAGQVDATVRFGVERFGIELCNAVLDA